MRLGAVALRDPARGGTEVEGEVIRVSEHPAIRPVLTLAAPRPFPGRSHPVSLCVIVDGVPDAKWQGEVVFDSGLASVEAGEVRFPPDLEPGTRISYVFAVFAGERLLGGRCARVCARHGPVTDVEGRLTLPFDEESVDLAAEARRIRREAGVP